jgi:hypothetical protein
MTSLKEWMDAQWQAPGVKFSGHGVAYIGTCLKDMQVRGGSNRTYKSKEQKAYEARFGIYNKKLVPIILAEATNTPRLVEVEIDSVGHRKRRFKEVMMPHYTWPKTESPAKTEQAPAIPRKRVPKAKIEQAAAIIAKVPQDELATFLAKFGLSLSLAASIASLDNAEMIARQFLRATL